MYTHFNFRGMHCTDKKRESERETAEKNRTATVHNSFPWGIFWLRGRRKKQAS